ncbi:hypothetical protein BpHYR1_029584 [Brachionus plicatilis]|uniref:Uncharacterized protein n=1 Tax=Brachionus plicatilis TaxID=10195 RepID=A0A3M7SKF5_BRAPC|nr:hypothetical protein BpHYR1_029584 [Brachionus plicatilis]
MNKEVLRNLPFILGFLIKNNSKYVTIYPFNLSMIFDQNKYCSPKILPVKIETIDDKKCKSNFDSLNKYMQKNSEKKAFFIFFIYHDKLKFKIKSQRDQIDFCNMAKFIKTLQYLNNTTRKIKVFSSFICFQNLHKQISHCQFFLNKNKYDNWKFSDFSINKIRIFDIFYREVDYLRISFSHHYVHQFKEAVWSLEPSQNRSLNHRATVLTKL